jgi:transcription initiation factor TFIIIB Brf1 subunit/transcription initiation factor TFIIB
MLRAPVQAKMRTLRHEEAISTFGDRSESDYRKIWAETKNFLYRLSKIERRA